MSTLLPNGGAPIVDDAPRLRVVRIHLNDWVASTRGLSLDEEGFFWRFTVLFYDRMGDLPDNDADNARAMNLDVRRYKFMKERMIARGKIAAVGGRLSNARAEREIANYVAEHKRRSASAMEREKGKRVADTQTKIDTEIEATSGSKSDRYRPDIEAKSDRYRVETGTDLSEKSNEINVCNATTLPQGDHEPRARARPKPKPKPTVSEVNPHTPPKGGLDPLDQAFEDFWAAFPEGRKQAKGDARDTFRKIVLGKHRKGLRAKAETLITAAARFAATRPDPEFTPMPSTWLNGGRWEDGCASQAPRPANTPAPHEGREWGWWRGKEDRLRGLELARWRKAIEDTKPNGTWPWWVLGAPPGDPECVVPPVLLEEFNYIAIYQGQITHV